MKHSSSTDLHSEYVSCQSIAQKRPDATKELTLWNINFSRKMHVNIVSSSDASECRMLTSNVVTGDWLSKIVFATRKTTKEMLSMQTQFASKLLSLSKSALYEHMLSINVCTCIHNQWSLAFTHNNLHIDPNRHNLFTNTVTVKRTKIEFIILFDTPPNHKQMCARPPRAPSCFHEFSPHQTWKFRNVCAISWVDECIVRVRVCACGWTDTVWLWGVTKHIWKKLCTCRPPYRSNGFYKFGYIHNIQWSWCSHANFAHTAAVTWHPGIYGI